MRRVEGFILDEAESGPAIFLPAACGWVKVTEATPVSKPLSRVLDKMGKVDLSE